MNGNSGCNCAKHNAVITSRFGKEEEGGWWGLLCTELLTNTSFMVTWGKERVIIHLVQEVQPFMASRYLGQVQGQQNLLTSESLPLLDST
ncbi:hypothetical protein XELAEV_18046094mg [Xenopus laevis]|uniref:Uncharacterized protein n=1 Tax=Xenopus laevis TaxID=8355 RepID=A0A974BS78_XENLA|nr:hypothetical protein XELAEV_18046094mg [Xenopus laevis]